MKKIRHFFTLWLSLVLMQGMNAQNVQWINPLPTGRVMHDIAFFDANHGLMCGEQGTILTTANGGSLWTETQQGNIAEYKQIEAMSNGTAWLRAKDHLLKTNDFGTTFFPLGQLPAGYSYKALSMFSATGGYALRYNPSLSQPNELGYTTNGGNTWTWTAFPPEIKEVANLRFADALHGVSFFKMSDGLYYLAYSYDGGNNWFTSYGPIAEYLYSQVLAVSANGVFYAGYAIYYAQGYESHIIKSTDQGQTWVQIYGPASGDGNIISHLKTLDDNFLFMAAAHPASKNIQQPQATNLLYSIDGGNTWNNVYTPSGFSFKVPSALGIKNSSEVFLFVNDEDTRQLFKTQSLGQLQPFVPNNFTNALGDLAFSQSKGYLFATNYPNTSETVTLVSTDGGNQWSPTPAVCEGGIPACGVFTSANLGYLCTSDADNNLRLYKTINGANSYEFLKTYPSSSLVLLKAFGPDTLLIITSAHANPGQALMEYSVNGGTTWEQKNLPSEPIFDADFTDGLHGCLFGGDSFGRLWKSTDGGSTWTDFSFVTGPFTKGQLITPHLAFSQTFHEGVYKILKINLIELFALETFVASPGEEIVDFSFSDENMGYVLTTFPGNNTQYLYRTMDGGTSWDLLGSYTHLSCIKTFYGENGFALGDFGQLIRLGNGYPLKNPKIAPNEEFLNITSMPGTLQLKISIHSTGTLPGNLQIYDAKGIKVLQAKINHPQVNLPHNLPSGLYIFHFQCNKQNHFGKILIKN